MPIPIMSPDTWKMIDHIRFYVGALLRGSPVELMIQRYPEWELDVGPDHFSLRRKLETPPAPPPITLTVPPPAAPAADPSAPPVPAPILNVQ